MDKQKTKVIFRKEKNEYTGDWDVVAFFPETYGEDGIGKLTCYAHIGQHGTADIMYYFTTKKATPEEYKDLYNELTNLVGYNLRVMQRMTYR